MKVMLLKPFPTYFNMFTYNIYQISFVISMTYTCVAIIWLFGTHPPTHPMVLMKKIQIWWSWGFMLLGHEKGHFSLPIIPHKKILKPFKLVTYGFCVGPIGQLNKVEINSNIHCWFLLGGGFQICTKVF